MSGQARIIECVDAIRSAQARLDKQIKFDLPVGTRIGACLGGVTVFGTVSGYCVPGARDGYVMITNERTGKVRRAYLGNRTAWWYA